MTKEQKEILVNVYNVLATMIPSPSEDFSAKHAFCLRTIREIVQENENCSNGGNEENKQDDKQQNRNK